jgi:hypothetical protein
MDLACVGTPETQKLLRSDQMRQSNINGPIHIGEDSPRGRQQIGERNLRAIPLGCQLAE